MDAALKEIVQKLKKEETRWDAILQLKVLKDARWVSQLIPLLADEDWVIRWCIAEKLGDFHDPRAIKALVGCLSDSDFHVRKNASKALLRIGVEVIPSLVSQFSNFDVRTRLLVLSIFLSMGTAAIPKLSKSLTGQDWVTSNRIVDTIGRLGGDQAEVALIQALSNEKAQKHAVILLGIMRSKRAVPHLLKAFDYPKLRRIVVYSLYRIGEKDAYPAIVTSLQSSSAGVASLSEKIVLKIGTPMLPFLVSALKLPRAKKRLILTVIGKIGVGPALPHIEKIMAHDAELRQLVEQLNLRGAAKKSSGGLLGFFKG